MMMDAITRLQEMAAKAEKELQEFEARFKEKASPAQRRFY